MNKKSTFRSVANNYLTHPYKEAGITLVALVVTIIVLLILAGITINLVLGNNGVLNRTQYASNTWANATADEEAMMGQFASDVDTLTAGYIQRQENNNEMLEINPNDKIVYIGNSYILRESGILSSYDANLIGENEVEAFGDNIGEIPIKSNVKYVSEDGNYNYYIDSDGNLYENFRKISQARITGNASSIIFDVFFDENGNYYSEGTLIGNCGNVLSCNREGEGYFVNSSEGLLFAGMSGVTDINNAKRFLGGNIIRLEDNTLLFTR